MTHPIRRAKRFLKENEGPIAFGAGIALGSILVASYPKFFFEWPVYNPDQPIPTLNMSEERIKRNVAASMMAVQFLAEKNLVGDFMTFSSQRASEMLKEIDQ